MMAKFYNAITPSVVGRSDYAANSGDYWTEPESEPGGWPASYGPSLLATFENPNGSETTRATAFGASAVVSTGLVYCGSLTKMATYRRREQYLSGRREIS